MISKSGFPAFSAKAVKQAVQASRRARISPAAGLDSAGWADRDFFERSYLPRKVLSGTGAGDTSIAAFLKAMLDGYNPEMAMHLAAGTGASCVEAYDSLSGLRSFEELKEKIAAGWEKVPGTAS